MGNENATAGQRLCIGFNGRSVATCDWRLLETVRPAGVVLFARNIGTRDELTHLIAELRRRLGADLLVAIDQEGGRVNRLRDVIGEVDSIAKLKQTDDVSRAEEFGRFTGRTLRALGINVDFAPVLDLQVGHGTVDNALQERCWGPRPGEVILWAGAFLDGLQAEGVAGCGKHFPGLGHSMHDSHEELPLVERTRDELRIDMEPFHALAGSLPSIMVGHACYPMIDSGPASLSAKIVTRLLREEMGFDGLVVTDDLEMGAVLHHTSIGRAALRAVQAGADLLLVCHTSEKILEAHAALAGCPVIPASAKRLEAFRARWK